MNATQQLFLHGSISKALLKLGIPIILINVLQSAYQLTDAFWVGRLGAAQVAAVSISMPVTFLVIAIGAGLAMAGAILSAQYMGAGQRDESKSCCRANYVNGDANSHSAGGHRLYAIALFFNPFRGRRRCLWRCT